MTTACSFVIAIILVGTKMLAQANFIYNKILSKLRLLVGIEKSTYYPKNCQLHLLIFLLLTSACVTKNTPRDPRGYSADKLAAELEIRNKKLAPDSDSEYIMPKSLSENEGDAMLPPPTVYLPYNGYMIPYTPDTSNATIPKKNRKEKIIKKKYAPLSRDNDAEYNFPLYLDN